MGLYVTWKKGIFEGKKEGFKEGYLVGSDVGGSELGSDVGVRAAAAKVIEKTQIRQGLKIVDPRRKPIKLKVSRNTGNSKAKPNRRIILNTKSK